jgi:ankyrin repeat protein
MRNLEPAVQAFIFERFKAKVRDNELNQVINPPDCFILTSYYINAYGTGPDFQEAIRLISMSSKKQYDHWQSRAYEYRICSALDPSFKPSEETEHNLFESAISGSRTALEDMKTVSPEKYPKAKSLLRELMCGVGANFFFPDQMLAGFTVWQWINTFNDLAIMVSNLRKLNRIVDYKVNKRGDGILHLAAALGKTDAIQSLLDSFPALTVNMPNGQGETPLLHACRAGQSETVRKLLALGGDASISTPAGESCLHWLVSFGDDEVPLIGQALIEAGADIRRQTRKRISYSIFPATIDVDFQLPGTPLAWAVHNNRPCIVKFLIEKAKDAMVCLDWPKDLLGPGSPVEMAALYHHVDCLIIMVDAMEEAKLGFTYGPFIQRATHAADTFSTILRHGCKYKDMLKATFDFLLERSKPATFSTGIGGFGLSLLFFAISAAHDTVVEYLLSPHLEALLGPFEQVIKVSYPGAYHPNDINRPCGDSDLTPLLEAVRWNRKHIVELLLAHGADPLATGRNPFSRTQKDWTALHVFANAGHNTDTSLVRILVEKGLPADGRVNHSSEKTPSEEHTTIPAKSGMICVETPLLVAIQNNAFNLATLFLDLGADPNALCLSSGLVTLPHPTTVLGHLIAASAQHTTSRLRYLIMDSPTNDKLDFIVTPSKNLSAIHLAARAHKDVWHRSSDEGDKSRPVSRKDYDMVVNEEIMQELLLRWGGEAHLNLKSGVEGGTALHLAVDAGNVEAVRLLVEKGADTTVTDDFGLTPAELGKALLKTGGLDMQLQEAVSRIDSYLEGVLHGM